MLSDEHKYLTSEPRSQTLKISLEKDTS